MLGLQHVVTLDIRLQHIAVAPPRGVRGLKYPLPVRSISSIRRTPSWGAWIEISSFPPPSPQAPSHPLVGCVD